MRVGGSLFLIALGAILRFAVTKRFSGVDLSTIGVILMIIGGVALLISLVWMSTRRRTDIVQNGNRTTYVTPHDPADTY